MIQHYQNQIASFYWLLCQHSILYTRDRPGAVSAYEESGLDALIDEADVISHVPEKGAAGDDAPKMGGVSAGVVYHEKDDG